ncbi:MAG: hypothetical protein C4B55_05860 [Candidatus Methanophagaceae archaeon]|nr:MAG: hypothetical protein C4B55_05860 [Methanophagales archaeon]
MKSKNDLAWAKLFEKYNILDEIAQNGCYTINSKQINEFRESRLMTNFDHKTNLPQIFQENNLSVLPLTRGSYVIAKFEAYQKVEYSKKVKAVPVPKREDLESLDYNNIYSESAALNCAYASRIIQDVLGGEECWLTVSGRMSTKTFNFCISVKIQELEKKKREINVENSQCEIDGGFESETKLALIEAKNTKCEDFLIRQIYYPYRLWKERVSKKVVPIFMTFSNDVFSFFIYEFEEAENYNSLKLVEQRDYIIAPEPINLGDIKLILERAKIISEPEVPFPQADKFSRIIDLFGLLVENELSKEEITSNYDFDKRQTDYYFNAGRYLELIEKFKDEDNTIRVKLTKNGLKIMSLPHKEKNLAIVKQILEHKPFKETLKFYLKKSEPPTKDEVVNIMKQCKLYNIDAETTYRRRAQTVLRWIEWILDISN